MYCAVFHQKREWKWHLSAAEMRRVEDQGRSLFLDGVVKITRLEYEVFLKSTLST